MSYLLNETGTYSAPLAEDRFEEAQQVEQEVDEVEVALHRHHDGAFPGVRCILRAEEVEQEEACKHRHADQGVNDVHSLAEGHEDADDADDDQAEKGEHQPAAEAAEVEAAENADGAASCHDAAGAEIGQEDRFPAENVGVVVDGGADEEAGNEGPDGQGADASGGGSLRCKRHREGADEEENAQADDGAQRGDARAGVGAEGGDDEAQREQKRDLGKESRLAHVNSCGAHMCLLPRRDFEICLLLECRPRQRREHTQECRCNRRSRPSPAETRCRRLRR